MTIEINEGSPSTLSLLFAEGLYTDYLRDPNAVPPDWRAYFDSLGLDGAFAKTPKVGPDFRPASVFNPPAINGVAKSNGNGHAANGVNGHNGHGNGTALVSGVSDAAVRQDRVDALVRAYRVRGQMKSKIDQLGLPRPTQAELDPEFYELTGYDLDRKFSSRTIFRCAGAHAARNFDATPQHLLSLDRRAVHAHRRSEGQKLATRSDGGLRKSHSALARRAAAHLDQADRCLDFSRSSFRKNSSAPRASLSGSESLIPLLAFAIDRAAEHGVDEVILGMAHRGRLNVLANIMGKNPREIFREFEDADPQLYYGSGDVKYHLGHSSDFVTESGKKVHLSLCFNPSHLEYVNPVVIGRTRAKQDRAGDLTRSKKIAFTIHGDAAFAGEGVIQETLNMSQVDAHTIGGTIHVIINNQIGFTTPPSQARSTTYATDVAKMLQIPIFHVNGEHPESVAQVVRLAMDFRDTFLRDVIIDMYCYRRWGHNESDEPSFTQPLLYAAIAERKSVREGYLGHLTKMGEITVEEADKIAVERREHLERELSERAPQRLRARARLVGRLLEGLPRRCRKRRAGRRHRRRTSALPGADLAPARVAGQFSPSPANREAVGRTPRDGQRRKTAQLGHGRAVGVRFARDRGHARALDRARLRPRHVQSSPRGLARRARRAHVHAAVQHGSRSGPDRDLQLGLERSRRARLRIRLQPGLAGRAGFVGGAVRRLCQRRAGHHRPVHR